MARRRDAARGLPKDIRSRLDEDVATRYALDVVAGKIPAGELIVAACRRHLEDLRRRKESGWVWNVDAVLRWQRFCSRIPIPDKPEKCFELQPWQVFTTGCVIGWQDAEGRRRFRRAYVEVARKNAKTMLLAALALYLSFFCGERSAEGYCLATKLEQAKKLYDYARDIILAVPELRMLNGRGTIESFGGIGPRAIPRLYDHATGSKFEPLPANAKKLDSLNPSFFVADELHEHPDSSVVDKLRTGQGARLEPLQFAISTAGDDTSSYCYAVRDRGVAILKGRIEDERAFYAIYHRDEKDKWWSRKAVEKSNPNLGVSVQWSFLEDELKRARTDPREENIARRMYLSDWVQQKTRVIPMERWDKCSGHPILESLKGRTCYGGLDLSRTRDMTAFALVFPPEPDDPDGLWTVLVWFWVPEEAARTREKRNITNYELWHKLGHLIYTDGDTIDFQALKRKIVELTTEYDVRAIGYDPWGATQLAQELETEEGITMLKVRQNLEHMAEPSGLFLDLVKTAKLRHGGQPVLRWMAENAEAKTNSEGAWKFVKSNDREKKVDGIIAVVEAIYCATVSPESQRAGSDREPLVIEGWS